MPSRFRTVAVLAVLATAIPAAAQFQTIETDRLSIVFPGGAESFLIPYLGKTFENSFKFQTKVLGFAPKEKVSLLLVDFSDSGNASAGAVPYNGLTFQMAPLSYAYETFAANERMNTYMNHELVHVTTLDAAAGSERFFRRLFAGKVVPEADHPESILYFFLTAARNASPRWYMEGSAVFFDTWMAGGIGRAQGSYDEMVFRSMVKDKSPFYDPLGLVAEGTKVDFQVGANAYLYGTRFITWLGFQYSPEKVAEWVGRRPGSKAYYAANFKHVFGKSLNAAWQDWIDWEKGFQQQNLDAIRKYPVTPYKDLADRALGSVSRAWVDPDTKRIYAGFNYPGVVAHIGSISLEDGTLDNLVDVKGPSLYTVASVAYDRESKTVFYTTDNNNFRDIVAHDTKTGEKKVLLKDARIGDLAWNAADRSLWGIRHLNGMCTLVRIPYPWTEWKQVRTWPYGPQVYDLDVSADGKLVSLSVGEVTGQQSVQVIPVETLMKGEAEPLMRHDFGTTVPSNFVFSPDARYVYGSTYYTGASNIFRFEIATGKMEALTNSETGFFRPIPGEGDELIVFRYTGEGFMPAKIQAKALDDINPITFLGQQVAERHPVVRDWNVGSPSLQKFEPKGEAHAYSALSHLGLETVYPVIEGYRDYVAPGLAFSFSDPALFLRAKLSASYTLDRSLPAAERLHVGFSARRYDWTARFKWNGADFYDLFGPTKTSRKGYAAGLSHKRFLVWDQPREMTLTVEADVYGKLDTLPGFQNVASKSNSIQSLSADLSYGNLRGSLGKVDFEKGIHWNLVGGIDRASGKSFPKLQGGFDVGQALPWGHASLFLRSAAGYAWGDEKNPLAAFYLGGFGNNWVDRGDEKRYRKWYAFPGVELNALGGRSFLKSTAEVNLPPLRFERAGNAGFYMSHIRPALFAGVAVMDPDRGSTRRTFWNAGAQLDLAITTLNVLDLVVSVGQAVAFQPGGKKNYETMVSLKVLK